ncbi:hypothetical protein Taro_042944, partial [Colocasia esculenta]|nr:hypothetical protein [Colocasia esculenta]
TEDGFSVKYVGRESVSSVRQSKKLDCRTKSEATKASQLPKYSHKKTVVQGGKKDCPRNVPSGALSNENKSVIDMSYRPQKVHSNFMETGGKEGNATNLSNAKDNRLPRKIKSASVSSNRPLKGSSSNTTTQRQTTTPCGFREIEPQISFSRSLNGSVYAQKQLGVQSTSNRHAANSLKAAGLENKREIPKAASILEKHTAVPRARDGRPQRLETRSIDLSSVKDYSLTSRAECGLGKRPKEVYA